MAIVPFSKLTDQQKQACVLAEKLMLLEQYRESGAMGTAMHTPSRDEHMTALKFSRQQMKTVWALRNWLQSSQPGSRRAWARYPRYRRELAAILGCLPDDIKTTSLSVRQEAQF